MFLLQSASDAVKALTTSHNGSEVPAPSIDERKQAFTTATSGYFRTLSTIDVNLRRQIYALEEASIIPVSSAREGTTSNEAGRDKDARGPGAMGKLDIGLLNSRTDKVGKDMEAELWAQAHDLMDGLEVKETNGSDGDVKAERQ